MGDNQGPHGQGPVSAVEIYFTRIIKRSLPITRDNFDMRKISKVFAAFVNC